MTLSVTDVKKIAKLARLSLDQGRASKLEHDFNRILPWVEQLNEIDTSNVEPMTGLEGHRLPMREDNVTETNLQTKILKSAPNTKYGYFVVPKVVE